jgi:transcriptional regulator with XRE-family HTH domain
MNQPDLGKKIAELRKAKGLTQEELVEKCNLSVRTLQRIESGEVMPRSYTIKAIFAALDHNHYDSSEIRYNWFGQFYISFIDLFNLKTNTMKKITILSIILSAIVLGIFAVNTNLSAQNKDKQRSENKKAEDSAKRELAFSDFTCYGCMEERGLVIGRDVSFMLNGVKVSNIRLITIDKVTREFNTSFGKGKFLERKVEVEYPKDMLVDGRLKYSSDNTKESDSSINLKGNARITRVNDKDKPGDDEYIEADEIRITLK